MVLKSDLIRMSPCHNATMKKLIQEWCSTSSTWLKITCKNLHKTVDSDVIVILVGLFLKIAAQVDDVWVEYGAGKYMQYISIRTMYNQLGESRAKALLFFTHSLVQIPHLHSATRAKKQPGILGRHLMKQQKHLRIWQLNHFCLLRMIQKR